MASQALPSHYRTPADAAGEADEDRGQFRFGQFVVRPLSRDLIRNGRPVCIGGRAFDLLVVLLRSRGDIVPKAEICRYVWPSTTVDESNLRFQMATLRKLLGTERHRIKTIPGRGYLFVAGPARPVVRATDFDEPKTPAIVIIDRDPQNRAALLRLLQPFDALVQSFGSMEAFLQSRDSLPIMRRA